MKSNCFNKTKLPFLKNPLQL